MYSKTLFLLLAAGSIGIVISKCLINYKKNGGVKNGGLLTPKQIKALYNEVKL